MVSPKLYRACVCLWFCRLRLHKRMSRLLLGQWLLSRLLLSHWPALATAGSSFSADYRVTSCIENV